MDHEALLRKYMGHVLEQESITFLDRIDERTGVGYTGETQFTPEEFAELRRIEGSFCVPD